MCPVRSHTGPKRGVTLAEKRPPSVRARRLAAELRRLRETSMLTGEEVAARLRWSPSKVSRIETCNSAVAIPDLRRLLDLYEISGSRREHLEELCRNASQRGWWARFEDALRQGYLTLLELEDEVESEHCFASVIVPGLLQTEAYAQEIVRPGRIFHPPGELSRRVAVRVNRQKVLTKDTPMALTVILDEAVLRRQMGGPEVMRGQLAHLLEMSRLSNVRLQVLPFAVGSHLAVNGAFTILHFPETIPADSDAVYLENLTSDGFVENEREVYQYIRVFEELCELALDREGSIHLIEQYLDEVE